MSWVDGYGENCYTAGMELKGKTNIAVGRQRNTKASEYELGDDLKRLYTERCELVI